MAGATLQRLIARGVADPASFSRAIVGGEIEPADMAMLAVELEERGLSDLAYLVELAQTGRIARDGRENVRGKIETLSGQAMLFDPNAGAKLRAELKRRREAAQNPVYIAGSSQPVVYASANGDAVVDKPQSRSGFLAAPSRKLGNLRTGVSEVDKVELRGLSDEELFSRNRDLVERINEEKGYLVERLKAGDPNFDQDEVDDPSDGFARKVLAGKSTWVSVQTMREVLNERRAQLREEQEGISVQAAREMGIRFDPKRDSLLSIGDAAEKSSSKAVRALGKRVNAIEERVIEIDGELDLLKQAYVRFKMAETLARHQTYE